MLLSSDVMWTTIMADLTLINCWHSILDVRFLFTNTWRRDLLYCGLAELLASYMSMVGVECIIVLKLAWNVWGLRKVLSTLQSIGWWEQYCCFYQLSNNYMLYVREPIGSGKQEIQRSSYELNSCTEIVNVYFFRLMIYLDMWWKIMVIKVDNSHKYSSKYQKLSCVNQHDAVWYHTKPGWLCAIIWLFP